VPFQSQRSCLEDALLNVAVLVFTADNKAKKFAPFKRIVTLKDETFVLCFDKGELARNAGQEQELLPVARGILGDGERS
jgi:hypothetical protein